MNRGGASSVFNSAVRRAATARAGNGPVQRRVLAQQQQQRAFIKPAYNLAKKVRTYRVEVRTVSWNISDILILISRDPSTTQIPRAGRGSVRCQCTGYSAARPLEVMVPGAVRELVREQDNPSWLRVVVGGFVAVLFFRRCDYWVG